MLKPVNPRSCVTVVASEDPAVDWDRIIAEECEREPKLKDVKDARGRFSMRCLELMGEDPSKSVELLPALSGEHLTKFVIGAIPSDEMVRIADDCRVGRLDIRLSELRWRAFLQGVRSIEGWGGSENELPTHEVAGVSYIKPAWLRETFIRGYRSIAMEIGQMVWTFNLLTEDDIKN